MKLQDVLFWFFAALLLGMVGYLILRIYFSIKPRQTRQADTGKDFLAHLQKNLAGVVCLDQSGPLPPTPRTPMLTTTKVKWVAVMRLKIVSLDPDTKEIVSDLYDVPSDINPLDLIEGFRGKTGREITKVVVLERRWEMVDAMTRVEKAAIFAGFYALLTR